MRKTHFKYGPEFRRNAVNLLLTSGRTLKEVSVDLGVCTASLRLWRRSILNPAAASQPVAAGAGAAGSGWVDPGVEIRRLQKELDYVRRQRDILKKAMSILSEDPQLGMR